MPRIYEKTMHRILKALVTSYFVGTSPLMLLSLGFSFADGALMMFSVSRFPDISFSLQILSCCSVQELIVQRIPAIYGDNPEYDFNIACCDARAVNDGETARVQPRSQHQVGSGAV
jgi:hypothetical protein